MQDVSHAGVLITTHMKVFTSCPTSSYDLHQLDLSPQILAKGLKY